MLNNEIEDDSMELCRDSSLRVLNNENGHDMDKMWKILCKIFCQLNLTATINTNLKEVNFLDININFSTEKI